MNLKDIVKDWSRGQGYKYVHIDENPQVIIVGERHDRLSLGIAEAEIISATGVHTVLHEYFHNSILDFKQGLLYENPTFPTPEPALEYARIHWDEVRAMRDSYFRQMLNSRNVKNTLRKFEYFHIANAFESDIIKEVAGELIDNLPDNVDRIVGCDRSAAEMSQYEHEHKILFGEATLKHNQYRNEQMGNTIAHHSSSEPVVAIVGAAHMRKYSLIHKILSDSGISYIAVDISPCSKSENKTLREKACLDLGSALTEIAERLVD